MDKTTEQDMHSNDSSSHSNLEDVSKVKEERLSPEPFEDFKPPILPQFETSGEYGVGDIPMEESEATGLDNFCHEDEVKSLNVRTKRAIL